MQRTKLNVGPKGLARSSLDSALSQLVKNQFPAFLKLEFEADVASIHLDWWEYLQLKSDCVFLSPRDHGKALALDTPVMTSTGWSTQGDLELGDEVKGLVNDWVEVIGKSEVYRGRPCYEVSFNYCAETFVCDANHQWEVECTDSEGRRSTRVVTTQYMAKHIDLSEQTPLYYNKRDVRSFRIRCPKYFEGDIEYSRQRTFFAIKNVRLLADSVPTQCIQVRSPDGMYCIGDHQIPTHNSHILARAYSIWNLKYNDYVTDVMILGSDAASAVENLDKLKALMKLNPHLNYLMPKSRSLYNSRTVIELTNGKIIKAKAFFASLRGRHPQLIIADDILSEKNSSTNDARLKTRKYFFEVVFPMKDKGTKKMRDAGYSPQIVVVGTAQDHDDLYHELLDNEYFNGTKQSAIVDVEKKKVLWPERYSYEDLMIIKKTVGSLSFAKEYCNEPILDDTSMFPPSLFKPMFDYHLSYQTTYSGANPTYSGADFSIPGDSSGDYTVNVVGEKIERDMIRILSLWRAQPLTMKEQTEKIEADAKNFNITNGFVEANMFQRVYANYFKEMTSLPIKGNVVTASAKNSYAKGVLSFRPLFENQKFIFPYKTPYDKEMTDMLVREFSGLVRKDGKLGNFRYHDDIVMALWHMLCASRQVQFQFSF